MSLGNSYSDAIINIDDFTKCYICLCKIQDATMCPNCQKISCQRCLQVTIVIFTLEMVNGKKKSMSSL